MNLLKFYRVAFATGLLAALSVQGVAAKQRSQKPEGFEQIIPRGRIAAVNDPVYVSADEAQIGSDSSVLGVVIDGEAMAYSLNLLNSHEVVNDSVGETDFAAVW